MNKHPLVATDVIIEYENGIVIIERKNPPYGLAMPGGKLEYGLDLINNVKKEAKEETGLQLKITHDPFLVRSSPQRDSRGHVVSVIFIGKGEGILKSGDDAKAAFVLSQNELVDLFGKNKFAFDHESTLKQYLDYTGETHD